MEPKPCPECETERDSPYDNIYVDTYNICMVCDSAKVDPKTLADRANEVIRLMKKEINNV
jgi:hypothetical protein